MKIRKSNYFYESARVVFYLRWYDPNKFTFNDMILIRKDYKAQQIPIMNSSSISSFNIYKNMNLDIRVLYDRHRPIDFKEFYHEVLLAII